MNNITTYLTTAMCPKCKKLLVINTNPGGSLTCTDCKKDFSIDESKIFDGGEFKINIHMDFITYKRIRKNFYGFLMYDMRNELATVSWLRTATLDDKTIQEIARNLQYMAEYTEEDEVKISSIKVQLNIYRAIRALESIGLLVEPNDESGENGASVANSLYDALTENADNIYRFLKIQDDSSRQELLDSKMSRFADEYVNNDEELIKRTFIG